jgi:hypothetical protein
MGIQTREIYRSAPNGDRWLLAHGLLVTPLAIDVANAQVTTVRINDIAYVIGAQFKWKLDLQSIELGKEPRPDLWHLTHLRRSKAGAQAR